MFCELCRYNLCETTFDEKDYQKENVIKNNSYNLTINPNCFNNPINVCYECLYKDIYDVDFLKMYYVLEDIKNKNSVKKIESWWLQISYDIDKFPNFVYSRKKSNL